MAYVECEANGWPEQEAVEKWLQKNEIYVSHQQSLELKHAVSKRRVETERELERLKFDMLPWWRKDHFGWPIEMPVNKGRAWRAGRLAVLNLRKLRRKP